MRGGLGEEGAPKACRTSGIESKAGCAGVWSTRPFVCPLMPFVALPLTTAGISWISAGMVAPLARPPAVLDSVQYAPPPSYEA